jgi:hypothetical protein
MVELEEPHYSGCKTEMYVYYIVLYCIDGVVIAAQCTATFLRSIVFPKFRYY